MFIFPIKGAPEGRFVKTLLSYFNMYEDTDYDIPMSPKEAKAAKLDLLDYLDNR